jgi:hypothetical protein
MLAMIHLGRDTAVFGEFSRQQRAVFGEFSRQQRPVRRGAISALE